MPYITQRQGRLRVVYKTQPIPAIGIIVLAIVYLLILPAELDNVIRLLKTCIIPGSGKQ